MDGENLEIDLDVDAGAADIKMDLTAAKVKNFNLDIGASNAEIVMPSGAGHVNADIQGGAWGFGIRGSGFGLSGTVVSLAICHVQGASVYGPFPPFPNP